MVSRGSRVSGRPRVRGLNPILLSNNSGAVVGAISSPFGQREWSVLGRPGVKCTWLLGILARRIPAEIRDRPTSRLFALAVIGRFNLGTESIEGPRDQDFDNNPAHKRETSLAQSSNSIKTTLTHSS